MAEMKDGSMLVSVRASLLRKIKEIDSANPELYCQNAIYNELKRDLFERGIEFDEVGAL